MKKSAVVLSILAFVFTVLGIVLIGLTPMISATNWLPTTGFVDTAQAFIDAFFTSTAPYAKAWSLVLEGNIYCVLAFAAVCVFLVLWLVHFIVLLARRRYRSLFPNLMWLIFGGITTGFCCMALVPGMLPLNEATAALSTNLNGVNVFRFLFLGQGETAAFVNSGENPVLAWVLAIVMALPAALGSLAWLFGIISVICGIGDCIANPGAKRDRSKAAERAKARALSDARLPVDDEDALKAAMYDELDPSPKAIVATTPEKKGDVPVIVQHIYYNGQPVSETRTEPKPEPKPEPAPAPEVKEQEKEIHIHIYNPAPEAKKEEPKPEPKPEPEPLPEPKPAPAPVEEERPLTARELRAIIKEALDDHDHPDNDRPLTDEDARQLVRQELNEYYDKELPDFEDDYIDDEDEGLLTIDELRDVIHEEIAEALAGLKPAEEAPAPEEPAEEPVQEEAAPAISKDDIKAIVQEEIAALVRSLDEKEAARKSEEDAKAEEAKKAEEAEAESAKAEALKKAEEEEALRAKKEEEERAAREEAAGPSAPSRIPS